MESDTIGLTAIIGTIGAILTVLIKLFDVFKSWKEGHDDDKRIKKEIDHTLKEIEFINNWLAAVNQSSQDAEADDRKAIALKRLDHLMQTYQSYCSEEKFIAEAPKPQKGNGWFYAMSIFLILVFMGMFVDDEDEWSLTYFQQSFDSDTVIGLAFFLVIWVYFYINSSFFGSRR